MTTLNSEYGSLYGKYKQASENVLAWLRGLYHSPSKVSLNAHLRLASTAVQDGISMPENILDSLQTAIELRIKAADFHRQSSTSDHGHEYMISVLQRILDTFHPPSRPSTPEGPPSPYTPYPQECHLPSPAATPYQQEFFIPYCDYGHFHHQQLQQQQQQQQPYEACYSPLSPPPPFNPPQAVVPGPDYPTWGAPQPNFEHDPAVVYAQLSFDMAGSMFERAPGY